MPPVLRFAKLASSVVGARAGNRDEGNPMRAAQSSKASAARAPSGYRADDRWKFARYEVCALGNLRRGLRRIVFGGEAVNQFVGAHVTEFFADAALEVAVVVAE